MDIFHQGGWGLDKNESTTINNELWPMTNNNVGWGGGFNRKGILGKGQLGHKNHTGFVWLTVFISMKPAIWWEREYTLLCQSPLSFFEGNSLWIECPLQATSALLNFGIVILKRQVGAQQSLFCKLSVALSSLSVSDPRHCLSSTNPICCEKVFYCLQVLMKTFRPNWNIPKQLR